MLKIILGNYDDVIYDTNMYFDNTFEEGWLNSDIAKEIVRDIDKSEIKSPHCIDSPVLGQIPPEKLSGGTKTLLLMINDDSNIYNISTCGDNCAKWILKIGKEKDITVNLGYFMDFGDGPFEIEIVNSGAIAHNNDEFVTEALKYI